MRRCYILYVTYPYDDPPPQDIAVYPELSWAEHMKKENEKENPDSTFMIVQSLLAEEGDIII